MAERGLAHWARRIARALWALVMFTLPVTSFRYFPHFFGTTQVKPLAFAPLAVFLPLALALAWRRRDWRWLGVLPPLLVFVAAAGLATLLGLARNPVPLFGLPYAGRALRAWLSLAVGLSFFLGALLAHPTKDEVRFSLRWLYAGFLLTALWGTLQIGAIKVGVPPFATLSALQAKFSVHGLPPRRIAGMAYEPSWFADQLVGLYMPWLVAALLSGYALFRRRWLTAGLLVWAGVLLVFTYSRSGVLVAVAAAGAVLLVWGLGWGGRWLMQRWRQALGVGSVALLLLAAGLAVLLHNNYFASLFQVQPGQSFVEYVISARGGSRLAYTWAALTLFAEHPWLGVGLGGSGFYLRERLPEWAVTMLPEIARLTAPGHAVVLNPKNMYVRVLAETGVVGFLAFVTFLSTALGRVLAWWRRPTSFARFVAVGGLWVVVAVVLRWFTQDSLAMPNLWLGLGMTLGPLFHNRRETSEGPLEGA